MSSGNSDPQLSPILFVAAIRNSLSVLYWSWCIYNSLKSRMWYLAVCRSAVWHATGHLLLIVRLQGLLVLFDLDGP